MLKNSSKWIAVMVLCFADFTTLSACFHEVNDKDSLIELLEKFYVHSDQINFSGNKIYVHLEDGIIFETPAIYSDENGFYIDKIAKSGQCSWYEWECRKENCRFCNLRGLDYECRACGFPISY